MWVDEENQEKTLYCIYCKCFSPESMWKQYQCPYCKIGTDKLHYATNLTVTEKGIRIVRQKRPFNLRKEITQIGLLVVAIIIILKLMEWF